MVSPEQPSEQSNGTTLRKAMGIGILVGLGAAFVDIMPQLKEETVHGDLLSAEAVLVAALALLITQRKDSKKGN